MTTPQPTLWPRDPHTEAKHLVLSGYWTAWFPILLQATFVKSITIFEGYAGPGEYQEEYPGAARPIGSPLIAMDVLLSSRAMAAIAKPVRFAFLEERADRVEHLRHLISMRYPGLPAHVTVEVRQGRCEHDSERFLADVGAWGHPIFANLDPFNAQVPLPLVERLARNDASEVFVTFMSDRLRRFASVVSFAEGDAMFGSMSWREVQRLTTPTEREAFLVERYRETLRRAGLDKVAGFKLVDEGGRAFWLLHATGHHRGLERMKDSMWKVDPIRGIRFRDPRDRGQGTLDLSTSWRPDIPPLRRLIVEYLEKAGRVDVDSVRKWVLEETAYRQPHAMDALRDLIADGAVGKAPARSQLSKGSEVWLIGPDVPQMFEF